METNCVTLVTSIIGYSVTECLCLLIEWSYVPTANTRTQSAGEPALLNVVKPSSCDEGHTKRVIVLFY